MKSFYHSFFGKINKFDLLVAFYTSCLVMAELMGSKTFPIINIFGYQLTTTVAIFLVPLIFTVNDVITEVYGKERTRSVIRSGLLMIAFIIVFATIATILPPSGRFAPFEEAYDTIFTKSIRISAASLTAFTIAEFMDVFIFVRVRKALGKSKLWLRNNASNFISQFFDTFIFMTLAFYSFQESFAENAEFLVGLILPYWLLKCFMSTVETPFVYLGVRWLRGSEKVVEKQ
jgi:hypothetical protein